MSLLPNDPDRMKPIIIVPPDMMSAEDIQLLRDNGLCVVVAADPAKVKFLDPIPSMAQRTKIEDASVKLSRKILDKRTFSNYPSGMARGDIARLFIDLLVEGTSLDPRAEVEREIYDQAKLEEVRKIAREEAREEAARKKAEKVKK